MSENDKVKGALRELSAFIISRCRQMGISSEALAKHTGLDTSIDTDVISDLSVRDLLNVCAALEIQPLFVPLELLQKGTIPTGGDPGPFMLAPSPSGDELYILSRHSPRCLIRVVPTVPVAFSIVDRYDHFHPDDIITTDFWDRVRAFLIKTQTSRN